MPLNHVKDGVLFTPCRPELVDGIITVATICPQYGGPLVVTSGSDGVHPAGGELDPHYLGYAFDMRISSFNQHELPLLVMDLKSALGDQWHVVLESDHIHCQHQGFKTAGS